MSIEKGLYYQYFRDVKSGMQKSKKTIWKSYFSAFPKSPSENIVFPYEMELLFMEKSKMLIDFVYITSTFATRNPECKKVSKPIGKVTFSRSRNHSQNVLETQ